MFFFIFGISKKPLGKVERKIWKNGFEVNAIITVYRSYIELFFIRLIPLKKSYSLYIPHSDEYFEDGDFSSMPAEYRMICEEAGRSF